MPTSVIPYIPETIVVHLGAPTASAANVTVPFPDYVKNVVSSEIYPTWEPAALEANTLAIISFALNRYYTEYYRSRGYDFDITSSTAIDQKYIEGRNIYENISVLVDEIFDRYLRRAGFVEPLAAKFCNGVTTTCEGLSQWGSQYLAEGGADAFSILRSYYGNIELVTNVPIQEPSPSYPGTPLRRGDTNADVALVQFMLNRISQNYPAIPKLTVDGVFGAATEESVRAFQSIFDLASDGIVGPATWYQLVLLYVAVQRLSELWSLGQTYTRYNWELPEPLSVGDTGSRVTFLQYVLSVLAAFIPSIPAADITGTYTENTQESVRAFQDFAGLSPTGSIDDATWNALYAQYAGIRQEVLSDGCAGGNPCLCLRYARRAARFHLPAAAHRRSGTALFRHIAISAIPRRRLCPRTAGRGGTAMILPEDYINRPVRSLQTMLQVLSTIFPALLNVNPDGIYGESTKNAVSAFQRFAHLPATGIAETETWNALAGCYLRHAPSVLPPEPLRIVLQPGQTIAPGERNLHVYLVQAMLQALGQCYANASPPAVTGVLDASTQRAVRRYVPG